MSEHSDGRYERVTNGVSYYSEKINNLFPKYSENRNGIKENLTGKKQGETKW